MILAFGISGLRPTSKYDQILVGIDHLEFVPKLSLGDTNGPGTRYDPGSTKYSSLTCLSSYYACPTDSNQMSQRHSSENEL